MLKNKKIIEELDAKILEKKGVLANIEEMEATDEEKEEMKRQVMEDIVLLEEGRKLAEQEPEPEPEPEPEKRSFNPIMSYRTAGKTSSSIETEDDIYATKEYRSAFKQYVQKGTPIPAKFKQKRDEATGITTSADIQAIIPTNILNRVIVDRPILTTLFDRVTKTNYQAGMRIPVAEANSPAEWIEEGTSGANNAVVVKEYINFMYYTLEKRISKTLVSGIVSLPVFETLIVQQLINSMMTAIELAIIKGSGEGQPTGIINTEVPEENISVVDEEGVVSLTTWMSIEAKIPVEYEDDRTVYLMAKPTWEKYLNGAIDDLGQRIGMTQIGTKNPRTLNGREVVLVNGLPSFDNAEEEEVFAVAVNLDEYYLNTNMQMMYKRFDDETNNTVVDKGLMICDGKIANKKAVILIKKG